MKTQTDYPLILTVQHISEIMQCSLYSARNLMNLKGFPVVAFGRVKRVGRDSFFKWLEWYQAEQMKVYEMEW